MGKIQSWKSITPRNILRASIAHGNVHSQTRVREYIYVYLETNTRVLLLFPFSIIPQYP